MLYNYYLCCFISSINNFTRTGYYNKKPFEYRNTFDWIINFLAMLKQTSYLAWTRNTSPRIAKKKRKCPLNFFIFY